MNGKTLNPKKLFMTRPIEICLPVRPRVAVTCPHCWTIQRAERDTCYHCGAQFTYSDETVRPKGA